VNKYSIIARMPDEPGTLQQTAGIIKRYDGNITRIQFDRRIDPCTVFFEVMAEKNSYDQITRELAALGYLQTSLKSLNFLKFSVHLPHRAGVLCEFLDFTTAAGANIASIDFDEAGRHPDRVTVSLNLEETAAIDRLLETLKSRYRLEILEYDTTGKHLDDTVFYVRYAQEVRELIGESEDEFLLSFLADTNHIVQELMDRGNDPRQVFASVLLTGQTMKATTGAHFYADIQRFAVTDVVDLWCFQLPCGGSIFVLDRPDGSLMIDTGYGIYHHDVMAMLASVGLGDKKRFTRLVITHADADHCGAGGFFDAPALMHEGTLAIILTNNRAYGSRSEHSVLEAFYTKMINLFSQFTPSRRIECFSAPTGRCRGIFPVLGTVSIGDIELEVLDGLGGHTVGQVFLYTEKHGLLFAADSVINFSSLSKERATYSSLAAFLVTSVNVDSDLAKKERQALLELVAETDRTLTGSGRCCLICGGHGAVSVLNDGKLVPSGEIRHYQPVRV
jgi:glyoxylase-like metal-dependent hydrolase (beta-lactamase superfamily II)/uncharacterized protein with ACT and thioredoxin-like domain